MARILTILLSLAALLTTAACGDDVAKGVKKSTRTTSRIGGGTSTCDSHMD